jgi:hypothetical protein
MSWQGRLKQAQAALSSQKAEPWLLRLERVRGQVGDDGIERITTQMLFDILEVRQGSRGAGACRRLATIMAELRWTAVRVRGLTRGGYKEQVRGYCRNSSALRSRCGIELNPTQPPGCPLTEHRDADGAIQRAAFLV